MNRLFTGHRTSRANSQNPNSYIGLDGLDSDLSLDHLTPEHYRNRLAAEFGTYPGKLIVPELKRSDARGRGHPPPMEAEKRLQIFKMLMMQAHQKNSVPFFDIVFIMFSQRR